MKQFFILFVISFTIFSGCSGHFERYVPSGEHEKATTSYKNVRLLNSNKKTRLVIASVYLNDVYPKYTDGYAHFLISFYDPDQKSTLYFNREKAADKKDFILLLNGEEALSSQELDSDDLLVDLMPVRNSWSQYYYVRYKLPSAKPVLVLESDRTEQAVITYQKVQE